jgi:hypothetical protein
MLKKIAYVIFIVSILFAVNNFEKVLTNGEERLMTTFNEVNFTLNETDLNIWGQYSKSYMNKTQMEVLAINVANELGLDKQYETDYIEEEYKKIYKIVKKTKKADTTIKVVELIEQVQGNGLQVENYIIINIILKDKCSSILYYREKINDLFKSRDMVGRDNLTITSVHRGKLDRETAKQVINTITKKMNCKIKDKYQTDDIYSIYGYSNYINDHIVTKGEKINIDLALTYSEEEDLTYLYAAIPVITIDY